MSGRPVEAAVEVASAPPEAVDVPTAQYIHAATPVRKRGIARVWGVTL